MSIDQKPIQIGISGSWSVSESDGECIGTSSIRVYDVNSGREIYNVTSIEFPPITFENYLQSPDVKIGVLINELELNGVKVSLKDQQGRTFQLCPHISPDQKSPEREVIHRECSSCAVLSSVPAVDECL